ncbi:MAG: GNAT family N-acetyltransferase [Anaerolineae bacterium]
MTQQITWSSGSTRDSEALSRLLLKTNYLYRSLVVRDSANLLVESESLLGWQGPELASALMARGDNFPVVDLLLAAASDAVVLDQLIHEGLPLLEARVTAKGGRWLCILGGPTWLTRLLSPRYELVDTVVFYQRRGSPKVPQPELIKGLQVRIVANTDLGQIKQVDEASFTPFWQANTSGLAHWLENANRGLTFTAGDRIVAFVLARLEGDCANIWRLAVLPEWQRRGLGMWLMTRILAGMLVDGANSISLNTQAGNRRARSLYEKLGFILTEQEVSVWARELG